MAAYYNEIDPYCAEWLRNLIAAGQIADGLVDTRPIQQVQPYDIMGFKQCHFFAGVGGWYIALRLAGVPDDAPIWTGSPPCQPFSPAGKREGKKDDRHLWPEWYRLIKAARPAIIFGEQVDAAIAFGWWDDTANDLEREGYATGAAVLPACSVNTPHKRNRLYFCAMGNPKHDGLPAAAQQGSDGTAIQYNAQRQDSAKQFKRASASGNVANANQSGLAGWSLSTESSDQLSAWASGLEYLPCPDGKERLIKSSIRLLAHDVPARASKLRSYGNAIVPPLAAQFIKASLEAIEELQ